MFQTLSAVSAGSGEGRASNNPRSARTQHTGRGPCTNRSESHTLLNCSTPCTETARFLISKMSVTKQPYHNERVSTNLHAAETHTHTHTHTRMFQKYTTDHIFANLCERIAKPAPTTQLCDISSCCQSAQQHCSFHATYIR